MKTMMAFAGACLALLGLALSGRESAVVPAPAVRSPPASFAAPPALVVRAPAPGAKAAPTLHEVEARVAALRAGGAGPDDIYRVRALALPARTVAQLEEREQAEQAWSRRLTAYRDARDSLGAPDEAQLDALRQRHFSDAEQRTLAIYESAGPQLR